MGYYIPWVILYDWFLLCLIHHVQSLIVKKPEKSYSYATVQVSHLALICDLSSRNKDQIWLNSIRNAFTVISAILVRYQLRFSYKQFYLFCTSDSLTHLISDVTSVPQYSSCDPDDTTG